MGFWGIRIREQDCFVEYRSAYEDYRLVSEDAGTNHPALTVVASLSRRKGGPEFWLSTLTTVAGCHP